MSLLEKHVVAIRTLQGEVQRLRQDRDELAAECDFQYRVHHATWEQLSGWSAGGLPPSLPEAVGQLVDTTITLQERVDMSAHDVPCPPPPPAKVPRKKPQPPAPRQRTKAPQPTRRELATSALEAFNKFKGAAPAEREAFADMLVALFGELARSGDNRFVRYTRPFSLLFAS